MACSFSCRVLHCTIRYGPVSGLCSSSAVLKTDDGVHSSPRSSTTRLVVLHTYTASRILPLLLVYTPFPDLTASHHCDIKLHQHRSRTSVLYCTVIGTRPGSHGARPISVVALTPIPAFRVPGSQLTGASAPRNILVSEACVLFCHQAAPKTHTTKYRSSTTHHHRPPPPPPHTTGDYYYCSHHIIPYHTLRFSYLHLPGQQCS